MVGCQHKRPDLMGKFFALIAFNRWGSSCQAGWLINRYFHSDRGVAWSDDLPGRRQITIRYRFCLATMVASVVVASNFLQQRGNDFYGLMFMLCRVGSGKEAFVPRNYLCFWWEAIREDIYGAVKRRGVLGIISGTRPGAFIR